MSEPIAWLLVGPQHHDWRISEPDLSDLVFLGRERGYDLYCWSCFTNGYAYDGSNWLDLTTIHTTGVADEIERRKAVLRESLLPNPSHAV